MEPGYRNKRIDWNYWTNLSHVKIWQACALSLEIDPASMNGRKYSHYDSGPGGGRVPGEPPGRVQLQVAQELERRISLVESQAMNRDFFSFPDARMNYREDVRLAECAAFLKHLGRKPDLPSELSELIETLESSDNGSSSADGKGHIGPLQRQRYQEGEIVRTILELKENPLALPLPEKNGLPGIKAKVKEKLVPDPMTERVFEKAWERCRALKLIIDR